MSCLATIGNLLVWLVILCAGIAIIRILLGAIVGIPWTWPAVRSPQVAPAPALGGFAGIVGVVIAILDVVFWAVIVIALIWFAVDVIGCLGGLRLGSPFR